MQHTKGSWKIGKNNIVSTKEEYGECRKGHVEIDAPGWGGLIICHRHEINENDNECLANAKLIAAAPELLEALQELLQVKEWKDKNGKDEHYLKAQPVAWQNAKAAINKAVNP